jgi:hypothetical protein
VHVDSRPVHIRLATFRGHHGQESEEGKEDGEENSQEEDSQEEEVTGLATNLSLHPISISDVTRHVAKRNQSLLLGFRCCGNEW